MVRLRDEIFAKYKAGGHVQPESWTHGASEQRVRWFKNGLEHGRIDMCDTFKADRL